MTNKKLICKTLLIVFAVVMAFSCATLCLYNKRSDTLVEHGLRKINNEEYVYFHDRLYEEIDYEVYKEEIHKKHWQSNKHNRELNGEENYEFDPWSPSQADYILVGGKADILDIWAPAVLQPHMITSDLDKYHPEFVNVYGPGYNEYYKICD